jgi:hypothetical protein
LANNKLNKLLGEKNQESVEVLIDEAIKWKMEAFCRKYVERIDDLETN